MEVASSYNSKAQSGRIPTKKSRTFLDNGKRVTVQSMERMEIRLRQIFGQYMLVERRVNGFVEASGTNSK
jgi:hypothetical protein